MYNLLSTDQLQSLHNATLALLKKTGLRIDCADFHKPLEECGAQVNNSTRVVRFPERLIEDTIEFLRSEIASGRKQYLLNGVTNPRWTPPHGNKFGGACIEYYDWKSGQIRRPTETDLIRLLQLGETLEDVGFVGNPVACLVDKDGKDIPGSMQRIKTASVVAKYTTKCGSTEVWNEKELDLLIEIGEIVRGGSEAYREMPCFITAKETIAPLQFPEDDGKVLLMLARRGLPCLIVPMPISGATCPASVASNIVMANAEILGVLTALHCAVPDAMIGGGVISGSLDMSSGSAFFATPEVIQQDAGLAQLYDEFYGQDLAIGTGYTDAGYPGAQVMAEKAFKMLAAAFQGRFNFPVGLLAGCKRFSPEQAVLDLELASQIKKMTSHVSADESSIALNIMEEVGIGGEFISHVHTLMNFTSFWMPEMFGKAKDIVEAAHARVTEIWDRDDLYRIDEDRAKAIDELVIKAERIL
jgi:trimethylamine--corrinoid protein Co-methyltransferase